MDFTSEAMQKTLDIAKPEIHKVEDVHGITAQFSTKPLHQVEAAAPKEPAPVSVATLAGIRDLILAKLEGFDYPAKFIIHVENEQTVALKAQSTDGYGRRLTLIKAQPVPFDRFKFGQWHDQESFAIALASLFADTPDKAYVLSMASSLTNDATSNSEDDGFTQRATVKAGLRMKEQITLKPRVDLAPFRTFPELDQPISQFVLRARTMGETPALMLVEADGGRWKVDAIAKIAEALKAFNLNIPIIA